IESEWIIPNSIGGLPTDVEQVGEYLAESRVTAQRPLFAGISIGRAGANEYGTLGCFVQDREDGQLLLLSNNHVIAAENAAVRGDRILQPAGGDNGQTPADVVGSLERFVSLRRRLAPANEVDAGIGSISHGIEVHC